MPKNRPEHRLYDNRIVDRFVGRGDVTDKDYERYLKQLPDLGEAADTIGVAPPEADDEDSKA